MPFNHLRPELNQTIIFSEMPILDEYPIEGANGRLIPGAEYSKREFKLMQRLVKLQENSDLLLPLTLPREWQLGRITLNKVSGCWELPIYKDPQNIARYAQLSIAGLDKSDTAAHRNMFRIFYGKDAIPEGYMVDHLCENKPCCYPRHLEAIPGAANTRRGQLAAKHSIGQYGIEY